MNLNNFTIKSQEAIQQAQQITTGLGQQAIETGHILKGILEIDESVTPFILQKLGVNINNLKLALGKIVEGYPKVTGGNQHLSPNGQKALQKASLLLKEFNDDYVTIEHLLLGLLDTGDTIAQLMKDSGVKEKELKAAIKELRKGENVTSQSQEEQYNALKKYAKNLNELAKENKLDPVIGRDEEIRRVLQIL